MNACILTLCVLLAIQDMISIEAGMWTKVKKTSRKYFHIEFECCMYIKCSKPDVCVKSKLNSKMCVCHETTKEKEQSEQELDD